MDTGEAHLRKRSVPFRYAIKDFTMIVRQGTSHGLDVLPESIQSRAIQPLAIRENRTVYLATPKLKQGRLDSRCANKNPQQASEYSCESLPCDFLLTHTTWQSLP